jgi:hypothetical protein
MERFMCHDRNFFLAETGATEPSRVKFMHGRKNMKSDLFYDLEKKEGFLRGIRKLKERGVSIYIDDHESKEEEWPVLLKEPEEAYFYMGDFIEDPDTGKLLSVHFDRVTHEMI